MAPTGGSQQCGKMPSMEAGAAGAAAPNEICREERASPSIGS